MGGKNKKAKAAEPEAAKVAEPVPEPVKKAEPAPVKKAEPVPEPVAAVVEAKADDDEEVPELEDQAGEGDGHTFNRNEKKCRKALQKVGMKVLNGVIRVTLKKRDGLIFVIDDPEVLNLDNSYAIFGELKLEDLNRQMQMDQAKKFASQAPAAKTNAVKNAAPADDGAPLGEEGLTANHIKMVMDHTNCTRNQAIKALRETNDDMVQAVMKMTDS